MPSYTFACKDCGTRKTEVARMSEVSDLHPVCLQCNEPMVRDYQSDLCNTPNDSYSKPLHSDALAIAPSQRKEHERLYPYIKLDEKCRPVFDKFTNHEKYLKATGFFKNPGKSKRRSTPVSR